MRKNIFVSEIKVLATAITPQGFLKCEGQILSVTDYPALFAMISNNYGGDGVTNFAIPDLSNKSLIHPSVSRPLYDTGGSNTVTLLEGNLPTHAHELGGGAVGKIKATTDPADENAPDISFALGIASVAVYSGNGAEAGIYAGGVEISGQTDSVGGSQPLNIINPYLAMNHYIAYEGILPV